MFAQTKAERLPITKDILTKIISQPITTLDDLNIDAAFKTAWAEFLRLGEITYSSTDRKKLAFIHTSPTRGDVSFAEDDQFATLWLKQSKTDVDHMGVQIILAASQNPTCLVTALRRLFIENPQPPNAHLFSIGNAFPRSSVISIFRKRLVACGIPDTGYSGYSFCKGAAQHAANHGMLKENIQQLGRWTSNVFQLYFQTSQASLFNLNLSFQKGRPVAVPRATPAHNTTIPTVQGAPQLLQ